MPPFKKHKVRLSALDLRSADIGECLGLMCTAQFAGVITARAQISYNSCNAAVAIEELGFYDKMPTFNASVLYGSSRAFFGLDPTFLATLFQINHGQFSSSTDEQHAEQVAIKLGATAGNLYKDAAGECHVFVELSPCLDCAAWLEDRAETWNVHYLYDYEKTTSKEFGSAKRRQMKAIPGYKEARDMRIKKYQQLQKEMRTGQFEDKRK